jgi:hypothetical protein
MAVELFWSGDHCIDKVRAKLNFCIGQNRPRKIYALTVYSGQISPAKITAVKVHGY